MLELDWHAFDKALRLVNDASRKLESLAELDDETFRFERARSPAAMREMAAQIQKNRPLPELELLEQHLRRAINRQEFERAAPSRDRIRALKKQPSG
jgi:protein-arginine kinase activator protein McsA